VGESASGKSTTEKVLCRDYGYKRIVSYTTRPQRFNEADGVDYYFITDEEFKRLLDADFFAEQSTYRGCHYGISKEDCTSGKVVVTNPHGLEQLNKIFPSLVTSFYLRVGKRKRLIRLVKRGDKILECFRRIISDQKVFQNAAGECSHVIECSDMQPSTIAKIIHTKTGGLL